MDSFASDAGDFLRQRLLLGASGATAGCQFFKTRLLQEAHRAEADSRENVRLLPACRREHRIESHARTRDAAAAVERHRVI